MIRSCDGVDLCQTHLFHQAVLQRPEQPLDPAFRLRTVRRDPFHSQFLQGSPKLRARWLSRQLFFPLCRPSWSENAVFIGVKATGRPAPLAIPAASADSLPWSPAPQSVPRSGSWHRRSGRSTVAAAALFQPAKGRTVHHHQFPKRGPTLPPHMHGLHRCRRGFHSPAWLIHCRNVSRLIRSPCPASFSAANVGPKSAYRRRTPRSIRSCCPAGILRFDGRPRERWISPPSPSSFHRLAIRRTCRVLRAQTYTGFRSASDARARLRATLSIAPALSGSTRSLLSHRPSRTL